MLIKANIPGGIGWYLTRFTLLQPMRKKVLFVQHGQKGLSSYVAKIRHAQRIKENDQECTSSLPNGQFLVFQGPHPLMKFSTDRNQQLLWLSQPELEEVHGYSPKSVVFLDVDDNLVPRFSVQLGSLDTETVKRFMDTKGATFMDMRRALFMVDWKEAELLSKANALLMFNRNNKFCGHCGSHMKANVAANSRMCSSCSQVVYPYSNPVGIVLVVDESDENAVLVRQPRHPRGMFSCIAGFAEVGESLEATVKREVAEEVGLEVEHVTYVASQHWPFPGSLMAGCYAFTRGRDLRIDKNELESANWFSRHQLQEAIDLSMLKPELRFINTEDKFFVPPAGAIAHHLILHWLLKTPYSKIYKAIY